MTAFRMRYRRTTSGTGFVYVLLLAFFLFMVPLSSAHHQITSLHSVSFTEKGEYYDVGAAAPPPWHKSLAPPLPRLFWSLQTDLALSRPGLAARFGEAIPLLLKQERLDPLKYTSNYVDHAPF